MSFEDGFLEKAEERIFSLTLEDAASELSVERMRHGLAKMLYTLESLGADATETFCVFGPDATITRNRGRWGSGFGYGCVLQWPGENQTGEKLVFPEVRPNACGMVIGISEEKAPSPETIIERIDGIKAGSLHVMDMQVEWDCSKGNHFLEVLEVRESNLEQLPTGTHAAVIHTSTSEFKQRLYDCMEGAERVKTPYGECYLHSGKGAVEYWRYYLKAEEFSRKKREAILSEIFPGFEVLCNPTHQGLSAPNVIRLGLYDSLDKSTCSLGEPLFPLALRHDLPVYLIRGLPNLSRKILEASGFNERARDLGIESLLEGVNVLPHGGGYGIDIKDLEATNGTLSNPRAVPYYYRGEEVLHKVVEHSLGEVVAEMHQVHSLKV